MCGRKAGTAAENCAVGTGRYTRVGDWIDRVADNIVILARTDEPDDGRKDHG